MPRYSKEYLAGQPLSEREKEVLALLALGLGNYQIAEDIHVSTYTIRNHLWSIRIKTGIYSRTLLAFYAYANGLVGKEAIKYAIKRERAIEGWMRANSITSPSSHKT